MPQKTNTHLNGSHLSYQSSFWGQSISHGVCPQSMCPNSHQWDLPIECHPPDSTSRSKLTTLCVWSKTGRQIWLSAYCTSVFESTSCHQILGDTCAVGARESHLWNGQCVLCRFTNQWQTIYPCIDTQTADYPSILTPFSRTWVLSWAPACTCSYLAWYLWAGSSPLLSMHLWVYESFCCQPTISMHTLSTCVFLCQLPEISTLVGVCRMPQNQTDINPTLVLFNKSMII